MKKRKNNIWLTIGVIVICVLLLYWLFARTLIVEDEELGLGADIDGVADTGRLQIGFCTVGERTRITFIALAGRRRGLT